MKIVLKSACKNILPQKLADSVYEQKKKKKIAFFAQLLQNIRVNGMEKRLVLYWSKQF